MSLFPMYDPSRTYSNMVAVAKNDIFENVVHRKIQALLDCLKKCSMAARRNKVRKSLISLCDAQMFAELYMQIGANGLVKLSAYDMSSDEGVAMMQKVKGYEEFDPDDFHGYGDRNAQFLEKFAESVINKQSKGLKFSQVEKSLCDTLGCEDAAAEHLSTTAGSWISADYMEERFGRRCDIFIMCLQDSPRTGGIADVLDLESLCQLYAFDTGETFERVCNSFNVEDSASVRRWIRHPALSHFDFDERNGLGRDKTIKAMASFRDTAIRKEAADKPFSAKENALIRALGLKIPR